MPPSASASPSCSATTTSTSSRPRAARRRSRSCEERRQRLRGPRSQPAGHERASRSWKGSATMRASPTFRSWCSPGRELTPEEDAQLHTMARSVVVKGVELPERLLDETALFLHRLVVRSAAGEAAHAGAAAQLGRGPRRPHRPAGRRRRAQYLRAEQRSRAPRHARPDRHHRQGGDRHPASRSPRSPSR